MPVQTETSAQTELETLDESARSVVDWSRTLASHYGGDVVRLNHLFLAFLEQREALESCVNEVLQALLRSLGTRHEWVDALPNLTVHLDNSAPLAGPGAVASRGAALRLSEDFRGVIERAESLALRLGDASVGAKHLLISLFSDELRQFREKFLTAGSAALLDEARQAAREIVDAARLDATRIVQGARKEAEKILEKAETDALRAEVLVRTKEEIVRIVSRSAEGWTLTRLADRLGVSWQSLIWPCRQLLADGRLRKRGKLYFGPAAD